MDSDGTVMISDFGVAGWVKQPGDRTSERRTFVGTPCWMAPEVMEQADAYDEKADIWSLGITALELAKGYAPYARLNPMTVMIQTIREDPPSLKTYEDYAKPKVKFSRQFKEIVALCLQKNPKLRPSAATLLGKSFFRKARPKSTLVKELLQAVPIPDTKDMDRKNLQQKTVEAAANKVANLNVANPNPNPNPNPLEGKETGVSFVHGATWDFDEDDSKKGSKTAGGESGNFDFDEFQAMYNKSSVKDEEGVVTGAADNATGPVDTEGAGGKAPSPSS